MSQVLTATSCRPRPSRWEPAGLTSPPAEPAPPTTPTPPVRSRRVPSQADAARRPDGLVGMTMRPTRESWMVSESGSSTTWSGWTVVASIVSGRNTPASTRKATSRSVNPPPCRCEHPGGSWPRCRRRPAPPKAALWLRPRRPWPRPSWQPPPRGRCSGALGPAVRSQLVGQARHRHTASSVRDLYRVFAHGTASC
jgi:hypothetical protein